MDETHFAIMRAGVRQLCAEAAATPLQALNEAEAGVPTDVRQNLLACAIQNERISYHWLCRLYKLGAKDANEAATDLIRAALEAFTDQESPVDLRDWVKSAQTYLRQVDHA